jgi:hypothetical protein
MKLSRIVMMVIFATGCLQMAAAVKPDTIWLCRDTLIEQYYKRVMLADTFPDNRDTFELVDTGDVLDGMYVNFDYQFGNPHPGYAGFKFYWDYGSLKFYVAEYDSMVFWHKGPLPGHKVKMIWAQGSAGCGTPINYQAFGEFKSSAEWKKESFGFPEKRGDVSAYPDSPFVKKGLFELRMLIQNDDGTTSETSPPGCLKIDNMYFVKNTTHSAKSIKIPVKVINTDHFIPKVSGKVTLTIFSLQGEQLFEESVDVTAGKTYNVIRFARKNSMLPKKWVQCVHIFGAGVNVTRKVVY